MLLETLSGWDGGSSVFLLWQTRSSPVNLSGDQLQTGYHLWVLTTSRQEHSLFWTLKACGCKAAGLSHGYHTEMSDDLWRVWAVSSDTSVLFRSSQMLKKGKGGGENYNQKECRNNTRSVHQRRVWKTLLSVLSLTANPWFPNLLCAICPHLKRWGEG